MQSINGKKAFTLIELILSITIFAVIMIIAVDSLGKIGIIRNKISDRTDLNKDLYYSVENLVSIIKDFGGQIDYEEYWNRQAVGTQTQSGHYSIFSSYGNYGSGGDLKNGVLSNNGLNYGDGFYYCRSGSGSVNGMGTGGCLINFNTYGTDPSGVSSSLSGIVQRYGEYSFQFIDHNSNKNSDGGLLGDENGDLKIRGDDDDENLGIGPLAFSGNEVKELYLINKGQKYTRLLIRFNIKQDSSAPFACINNGTGSGCLGNIEILKLEGKDLGFSHTGNISITSTGRYDGIIDTWKCNNDFKCNGSNDLPRGDDDEWVPLFPDYINVKDAKFFIYPNKDYKLSWKDSDINTNINPYVRININLGYAWSRRLKFNNSDPSVNVSTTINLNKN